MADKSLFGRLRTLFSNDVVIRNVGGKELKIADVNKIQNPAEFAYASKTFGPTTFNHTLGDSWKKSVPWHSLHCHKHLQTHSLYCRNCIFGKVNVDFKVIDVEAPEETGDEV